MNKTICVYCSSSNAIDSVYFEAAEKLGQAIASLGYDLAYGGGNVGLMGRLAKTVQAGGKSVYGVIPKDLNVKGVAFDEAEELIVTKDLRERKAIMEERAGGFIVMPGGFGTLEEAAEIITLKQLGYHKKPIVFLNIKNFFDLLFRFFELFFDEHFSKPQFRELYYITSNPREAMEHIDNYKPVDLPRKWY